jgi:hypothetical protein
MKLIQVLSFTIISLFCVNSYAQNKIDENFDLKWMEGGLAHTISDGTTEIVPYFKDAFFSKDQNPLPQFHTSYKLKNNSAIKASISNVVYEDVDVEYNYGAQKQTTEIELKTYLTKSRQNYYAHVEFIPIINKGQKYQKVVSFDLSLEFTKEDSPLRKAPPFKNTSSLSSGDLYKLKISENGMHVLTYDFLKSEVGIDVDNLDPNDIQIFAGAQGMLPELNSVSRTDDLEAVTMELIGTADGSFDAQDKIIFYGQSASVDRFDIASNTSSRPINIYDDSNYYFLKIGDVNQNLIQDISSISNTAGSTNQYDYFTQIEEDNINILHEYPFTQGSGKIWYMQKFEGLREQTYEINIPNVVPNSSARFRSLFAGRSETSTRFNMVINGESFDSPSIAGVRTTDIESSHARRVDFLKTVTLTGDNNVLKIEYRAISFASTGWLDYINVNARCQLILEEGELTFRDYSSLQNPTTTFNLRSNVSDTRVWNISNPLNARNINLGGITTGNISFGLNTSTLQNMIAFDYANVNRQPEFIEQIDNQNLHNVQSADVVIIYPIEFEAQANELAEHRRSFNQFEVQTVLIDDIYNEFSSGKKDPTAVKDFCRMIYSRDADFKYLVLFGDGSFDTRGRYSEISIKSDFIPVYEEDSLNPIFSYPMDDYYALLDDDEGGDVFGGLEIAVGRLPVKTASEAQLVVNKIINYETSPSQLGNWRNEVAFIADDEDNNTHLIDADGIAESVRNDYPQYNINKLYADAYVQISTPGGEKYPRMTEEINKVMFQGALLVNYLGHGGSKGWAQERFLDLSDIASWTNADKQPLMVTATCSFTGFDDASFVTAGERCFLNPNGGAIGLMTTVRAVFASSNEKLARSVFDRVFVKLDGKTPPFGDIMLEGKNAQGNNNDNTRKFALIGDPAMRIAIPQHKVQTLSINGNPIDSMLRDTINALDRVMITGQVTSQNDEVLNNFDGKVFVKVFDKVEDIPTLRNDPRSFRQTFKSQKNLIFSGAASVTNGQFSIEFVVPKDINYDFGEGKISYYATDQNTMDATGFFTGFIVGGTNPDGIVDNEPPKVEVFMDNFNFVLGGTTTPDPILLVKLSDNLGINVAGSSIGHDLTGILDQDNTQSFSLNDFYEAKLDDFTQGTVRYPLFDLENGRHEIKVKAWDVANNSAEGFTEFIVADNQSLALEHVLNYPNPFTTNTQFMFEHNLPGQVLDIQVRIFTVSGKLVKSITTEAISDGNSVRNINWDGKDDFGGDLARGVYLYKIKASPSENDNISASESEFEKLVILK